MKATLSHLVRVEKGVRSLSDARKKVDRYIYSYRCKGDEWRRSIEVKAGSIAPEPFDEIDVQA